MWVEREIGVLRSRFRRLAFPLWNDRVRGDLVVRIRAFGGLWYIFLGGLLGYLRFSVMAFIGDPNLDIYVNGAWLFQKHPKPS